MTSYDRQSTETPKAYAAFTIYRDMGVSRSLWLVTVIKAIALFAQTGSQINADGLLIRQLIEHIKDNESS